MEKIFHRTIVFAHYDRDKKIKDYVVYYLKCLRKFAENIIFVSDSYIDEKELKKIKKYCMHTITEHHGEYDFGSYKRGFLYLQEQGLLQNTDELIFCNDSVYAPLYPLEDMFNTMSPKKLDFWGNTANMEGYKLIENGVVGGFKVPHVQSYFVVFKPQVFNSEVFKEFILSVKPVVRKRVIIIKYEQGLTKVLKKSKFKWDVYCKLSLKRTKPHVKHYNKLLMKDKSPFIKCSLFNRPELYDNLIYKLKKYTKYNVRLISKSITEKQDEDL